MRAQLKALCPVTDRDTLYTFLCPDIAGKARPGQFVELKITDGHTPFLRRPISIFDVEGDCFSLLVRTVGAGTEQMTHWAPGMELDVLGPLGSGFTWTKADQRFVLAAGGMGLAPLNFLARSLVAEGKEVRLLFTPRREAELLGVLTARDGVAVTCAENRAGFTAALDELLVGGADQVCACGPEGLLEAVAGCGAPSQLSMERRMACGIGICLGCAIAIRDGDGFTYKKVCKDGPVFRGEEVVFHESP